MLMPRKGDLVFLLSSFLYEVFLFAGFAHREIGNAKKGQNGQKDSAVVQGKAYW